MKISDAKDLKSLGVETDGHHEESNVQRGRVSYPLTGEEQGSRIILGVFSGFVGVFGVDSGVSLLSIVLLCNSLSGFILATLPGTAPVRFILSDDGSKRVVDVLPEMRDQDWRDRIGYTEISTSIILVGLTHFYFTSQELSQLTFFFLFILSIFVFFGKMADSDRTEHIKKRLKMISLDEIDLD